MSDIANLPSLSTVSDKAVTADRLHARLLAGHSATEVIADLFGGPVRIRRLRGDGADFAPDRETWLLPAPEETIAHRRVLLLANELPVSEADIWYLPARLWPGMAATLRDTDIPFGTVVRPMRLARETFSARFGARGARYRLEHEAVLRDGNVPVALVAERYLNS